jgi:hypothetical protein
LVTEGLRHEQGPTKRWKNAPILPNQSTVSFLSALDGRLSPSLSQVASIRLSSGNVAPVFSIHLIPLSDQSTVNSDNLIAISGLSMGDTFRCVSLLAPFALSFFHFPRPFEKNSSNRRQAMQLFSSPSRILIKWLMIGCCHYAREQAVRLTAAAASRFFTAISPFASFSSFTFLRWNAQFSCCLFQRQKKKQIGKFTQLKRLK